MALDDLITSWNRILTISNIQKDTVKVTEKVVVASKLCWHCCHSWEGETLEYPFSYDNRSGHFKTGGQFCSWECIKGYGRDTMSRVLSGVHQVNIRHYRKMLTGKSDMVTPAPSRLVLKAFGGHMTIEEYRAHTRSEDYVINYGLKTKIVPYDTHEYKTAEINVSSAVAEKPLVINTTGVQNENMRLKRSKPLAPGHANIERTLGLNTFANFIKSS
ncbi:MYM-type zinc finger with FCS sequence motif [Paramecium bursaria Chlorella virus CVG-1]|nr:MYM-type zinc finger with FCS sequence motif [Paramecium bursaria Chlorella virus CVG-1]